MDEAETPTPDEPTDGRVRRARALREERRSQILDATRRVFAAKGYHAGSIKDIIDTAGIARGTFYLHFEGKRAVLDALLDQFLEQLRGMVRRVDVTSPIPAEEQLLDNVTRVISTFVANDDLTRILLREAVGLDVEFDQKLTHFYARVLDLVQRSIRTGMALGLVRPVDSRLAAFCVLGGLKEVIVQLMEAGGPPPDARELARAVLDLNLRGLLVPTVR
ncbi:MAG: hypothetical protein AMXMBFR64_18390 [Myxococcales bacterium]